jgi:hypothetical protein
VILVEPPLDRYLLAAVLPVPGALMAVAADAWRRAFATPAAGLHPPT